MKYFKGCEEGYIMLFRIYKLKPEVDDRLLEKGRQGRHLFLD